MAESEIAIRLLEDVIIPACGIKKAGDIVTASDCGDSWEWMLQRSRHKVVSFDDVSADATDEVSEVADEATADVSDDVETDTDTDAESDSESEVDAAESSETEVAGDTDAVAKIKEVLGEKKSRIDDICEDTGLTEEVVVAALTEANGFQKNQQGWWKVVKS